MNGTSETHNLFVYGTLRRGWNGRMARLLARHGEFLGTALCRGTLYEVGKYPAMVPGNRVVKGDLYRLPFHMLKRLDIHEGCAQGFRRPTEYHRVLLSVSLEGATTIEAWVYLYSRSVRRLRLLPGGDYLMSGGRSSQRC